MEKQKREIRRPPPRARGVAAVSQTADNQLKLDIPSDISFATGRADIKANFRPSDRFAEGLRNNPNAEVRIVSHRQHGSDAINNPLSLDRAESTRNYLTSARRGVRASRLAADRARPIASNDTADRPRANRRVEIFMGERQGPPRRYGLIA